MDAEGRIRSQRGSYYVECYRVGIADGHFKLVTNCQVTTERVRAALSPDPVRVGSVELSQPGVYVVGLFDEDHDTQTPAIKSGRPVRWAEQVLLICAPQ